jgi:hypothetical protein
MSKSCIRQTIVDNLKGNSKSYQINQDNSLLIVPYSKFRKEIAYSIANRLVSKGNKQFQIQNYGASVSLNNSLSDGVGVNIHPTKALLDAYNRKDNSTYRVKEGVNFVFEQNPELFSIGTTQQYSQYLDTIFPDSKVKDIVYHGTNKKFDRFDKSFINKSFENLIFFFKNRKNAEEWSEKSELNLKKDDLINDIIKLNTSMKEASIEDNILYALTQHFTLDNKEDLNNKHKDTFNKITILLNYLNLDIDDLYNLINSDLEIYRSSIRNSINNSPSEKIINNNRVISVVVNSQNPLILQDSYDYYLGKESGKKFTRDVNNNIENYDSLIAKDVTEYEDDSIKNRDTQYAVKESEQIHILGSQNDIEGFKNWINDGDSLNIKPGVSELFESNPKLVNIGTQEQYSQYLDTIFPDSKVKDIVYHGTQSEEFRGDKFIENSEFEGIFLSKNINYARSVQGEADRKVIFAIVNTINPLISPLTISNFSWEYTKDEALQEINNIQTSNYDSISGIDNIDGEFNKGVENSDVIVVKPEQIHILGSKQDIKDFEKFVNQKSIVKSQDAEVYEFAGEVYASLEDAENARKEIDEAVENIQFSLAENNTDYNFKAVTNINNNLPKVNQWFKQIGNNDTFWNKLNKDLQIPKEQIQLLKDSKGNNPEEKLLDFIANYSYTVEINTAIGAEKTAVTDEGGEGFISNGKTYVAEQGYSEAEYIEYSEEGRKEITFEEFENARKNSIIKEPTQYYSNLTVPGGTAYTENEIATPTITPSIKGHAAFSSDSGIGWFRSDEKQNYTEQDIDFLIDNMIKNGILQKNCS